jgi:hypothetical protein
MPRKIAFWDTLGDSFNFVFGHWGRFVHLAGGWILFAIVLFLAVLVAFGPEAVQQTQLNDAATLSAGHAVGALLLLILAIVSYTAFAVSWHRAVLLDDTQEPLRFRWREARFLMYMIVITLLSFGVLLGAVAVTGVAIGLLAAGATLFRDFHSVGGGAVALGVLAMLVAMIVLAPFLARFSLGLPAIAVEEPEGVFGRSWHRGWRNGWRLIWGPFICSLPLSIASGIFGLGQAGAFLLLDYSDAWRVVGLLGMVVCYALSTGAHFLAVAGAVTFLSLSYRQLTRDEVPRTPKKSDDGRNRHRPMSD